MPDSPATIVRDFCAAWDRLDWAAVFGAVTDDLVYHNIPMPVCHGIGAFRAFCTSIPISAARFEIHHLVAAGDVVLTERTDTLVTPAGTMVIRVMGVFEIRDGRIARWRDYFDPAEMAPKAG